MAAAVPSALERAPRVPWEVGTAHVSSVRRRRRVSGAATSDCGSASHPLSRPPFSTKLNICSQAQTSRGELWEPPPQGKAPGDPHPPEHPRTGGQARGQGPAPPQRARWPGRHRRDGVQVTLTPFLQLPSLMSLVLPPGHCCPNQVQLAAATPQTSAAETTNLTCKRSKAGVHLAVLRGGRRQDA